MAVDGPEPAEGDGSGDATPEPLGEASAELLDEAIRSGDLERVRSVATFMMARSGPLPTVEEYAGYERVLPGAADRILAMAEKSQNSAIAINEQDSATGRKAFMLSAFAGAYFPWVTLAAAVVLALAGQTGLAWVSGVLAAVSGGPQVVVNIRDAFNRGRDRDDDDEEEQS